MKFWILVRAKCVHRQKQLRRPQWTGFLLLLFLSFFLSSEALTFLPHMCNSLYTCLWQSSGSSGCLPGKPQLEGETSFTAQQPWSFQHLASTSFDLQLWFQVLFHAPYTLLCSCHTNALVSIILSRHCYNDEPSTVTRVMSEVWLLAKYV